MKKYNSARSIAAISFLLILAFFASDASATCAARVPYSLYHQTSSSGTNVGNPDVYYWNNTRKFSSVTRAGLVDGIIAATAAQNGYTLVHNPNTWFDIPICFYVYLENGTLYPGAANQPISGPSCGGWCYYTGQAAKCPEGYSLTSGSSSGGGVHCALVDTNLEVCPVDQNLADQPELGCGGGENSEAQIGNPCSAASGNKYQIESDFFANHEISFTRSYNSLYSQDVGFGRGWISRFNKRSEITGLSTVIRRDDGKGEVFTKNGQSWMSDSNPKLSLADGTLGGLLLRLPDGGTEEYDALGRILNETDSAGRVVWTYTHDAQSRLTSVVGRFGHRYDFSYDSNSHVVSVTDSSGSSIGYVYGANNNLVRANYPDGTAKLYHYENAALLNHLTGISHVSNAGTITRYSTYTYDTTGKASSTEHAGGVERFTLSYAQGTNTNTVTTVTDAAGTVEVMSFVANLTRKTLVSNVNQTDGKSLNQTFDANNNLVCKKDEEGRVTTYAYNGTNQKVSMTEGLTGTCSSPTITSATRTTTYQYISSSIELPTAIESPSVFSGVVKRTEVSYSNNLPVSITQRGYTPAGAAVVRTVTLAYNGSGQVTSINGPRTDVNDVTTLAYNNCATGGACGQLSSMTNALGHATTFNSYDGSGRLLQMTAANGLRTNYLYDQRGRVIRVTQTPPTGSARVTQYTYTAAGDVATVLGPDGMLLTYTYNAARLLTRVTDNLGNYVAYGYDLKGNRTSEYTYDPSNTLVRRVDLSHDIRDHVASVNQAGSLTQELHDALGNLVRTTDPNNNPPTTNSYDALNRVIQTLNSLSGTTSYGYDSNDRLRQVVAPNSATTQYSYDDLGNLLQEVSPDRGTTTYTYDSAGNVITTTDARGIVITHTYDALNRLTTANYPGTTEDIAYTYDTGCTSFGMGKLCQITDASGSTVYGFDAFGSATQQQKTELGIIYTTSYTHDAADRIVSMTYPDGRVINYTRDALGRISNVNATVNATAQTVVNNRTYRADGVLASQSYGNGLNEVRQYDLQGRLVSQFLGSVDTRIYGHDANGNVTQIQSLPQVGQYQYDALDRLIQDAINPGSTQALAYDANGNRTVKDGRTYGYAPQSNRLIRVGASTITLDAAGNITSDGTTTYSYSNDGHLATVTTSGTLRGSYFYNSLRQRSRKVAGSTTTVYHYGLNGELLLETSNTGSTRVAYVYADEAPIAQITRNGSNDVPVYLHTDHLGTPRLATNTSGVKVWSYEGRAFGDTAPNQDPDGNGQRTIINKRFEGQYWDSESSLAYNWNRYYHAGLGRFLTSDPIGLEGGMNTYAYVENNPLRFTDPDGLKTMQCTKPLNALTNKFGSSTSKFAHDWAPALYHQYSCVVDKKGNVQCGGQDQGEDGKGKPSNDVLNPKDGQCEQTQPDNDCFEQCLKDEWAKPRPDYGVPFGTDCQEYDDAVNKKCRKQCGLKK